MTEHPLDAVALAVEALAVADRRGAKDWRRIATRYDKLARYFLAATALVGALFWIKL